METTLKIGEKLRTLRELHGIKQEDIAQRLGISQNTYSKLETGETDLTMSRLEEIAKIYNIKPLDLFNFDAKCVIQHFTNSNTNGTVNGDVHNHFEVERELYQNQIKQMQEEITTLKGIIEHFKKLT